MSVRRNEAGAGAGMVLGAAVLWGTVGPARVLADAPLSSAALGGWRLLVGGLVLWLVAGRRAATLRALRDRRALGALLGCALATGLYQVTFLLSVARTGAGLATVVALGTAPAATGLAARAVGGERVGAAWAASTAGSVLGCVLLLVPGGRAGGGADGAGVVCAVVSGVCYALYTVLAKRLIETVPAAHPPAVSALALTVGALPLVPWMAAGSRGLGHASSALLLGWLGLVATALAYWLFSTGLRGVGAGVVGTLSLAEPLAAALLGVLLLHERLGATAWCGCVLVFAGLAAASLPAGRGRGGGARMHGRGPGRTAGAPPPVSRGTSPPRSSCPGANAGSPSGRSPGRR
ncbi:DMT family transporter [Streptomyces fuscigenes]|uniref:DMT family transporter n=1 Tax=Streptomyces fuscigenes TaxID=1528880 RepID=UPI001F1B7273|nr:EamA family transporter [Streptomyces fuscigenes]MCF3961638.1 DMT family transporter [Streptomyces fuscigenes]